MGAFYIDDSVHDEAGFVIGACVYIKEEFEQDITEIITTNNEDPNTWEYKSNANYSKNSELIKIITFKLRSNNNPNPSSMGLC